MTRLLIIIPADILDAVREAASIDFGAEANSEFVPAGSPTGAEPATHYWLAGLFTDEHYVTVQQIAIGFPTAHLETYDFDVHPEKPFELLAEMGLKSIAKPLP